MTAEVTLHTHSLADYVSCISRADWQGVAELLLASARKLEMVGADLPDLPGQHDPPSLAARQPTSPLRWLHIAEVVADAAVERGFRRLGLLGTRWLVESDVYPEKLEARALEYLRPDTAEREKHQPHHHGRAGLWRRPTRSDRLSSGGHRPSEIGGL